MVLDCNKILFSKNGAAVELCSVLINAIWLQIWKKCVRTFRFQQKKFCPKLHLPKVIESEKKSVLEYEQNSET